MIRTICVLLACSIGLIVAAQDNRSLTVDQADLAARFAELESVAIRLAQQLEADDPARAQLLRATIEQSRGEGVTVRMQSLADLLRRGRFSDAAIGQAKIADALAQLLDELMADPQEAIAALQAEELRQALEQIDRLSARQQALRGASADEQSEAPQKAMAEEAERLASELGSKDGPTQGKPAPAGSAGPMSKAADAVKRAAESMRRAAEQMKQEDPSGVPKEQIAAERSLEEAREELDTRLRQLRKEERYRMLKQMSERFETMRAEQQSVLAATIEGAVLPADSRSLQAAGRALAKREQALANAAEAAMRVLREADAATAFLEATIQVAADMRAAELRLESAELGQRTQTIESAILLALEDAKECLEEAAEQARESSDGAEGPSPSAGGEPPLLAKIAELRMIRTLQKRVLSRTEAVQASIDSDPRRTPSAAEELQDLAGRQRRLVAALEDLMKDGT
ncbi:hypothetical protein Pla175_21180 [Pirellulimonas nuda]|uniref:Chromosome partition protein Smc n=1 Tax=Pirellulimonas nuda TaxID=2528009 RepID=A0A518DBB9_9BACT|nr:hypothetical protein [Pirellulimonas nuda]QDU88736.1 hypothetical protein Pla175_21180 [Pirellulimonas nuda]